MLKLKHHFHLPQINFQPHMPLKLAPVPVDDDELSQAIAADPIDHDNDWTLDERPDQTQLEEYWSTVTNDLKQDPDWVDFSRDDA